MPTVEELISRAVGAGEGSAERILFTAAAIQVLTRHLMVIVGGAAQVTYTGLARPTDVDLVGVLTDDDQQRLVEAGFNREGRHWVLERESVILAVEVPSAQLQAEEPPELFDVAGVSVGVISATDLMMDRLLQATDETPVTFDEAVALAVGAAEAIDWDRVAARVTRISRSDPLLGETLPAVLARVRDEAGLS